jgi:hypothetical protein
MKLLITQKILKNFTFTLLILISFTYQLKLNLKTRGDPPFADNQYRQANVPPALAVIIDMPAYGKSALFKWNDFIQANTNLITMNQRKNEDIIHKSYSDRLTRMGLLNSKITFNK